MPGRAKLATFSETELLAALRIWVSPNATKMRAMDPFSLVYFVQVGEDGPIKIGVSNHPWRRISSMQTGNPEPLRCVGFIPGEREQEQELHGRFDKLRLTGEWFKSAPSLVEFIRREASRPAWEGYAVAATPEDRGTITAMLQMGWHNVQDIVRIAYRARVALEGPDE